MHDTRDACEDDKRLIYPEKQVPMPFEFDVSLSAAQNIEKFYQHLESIDTEFAALLKTNLPPLLPVLEVPVQKKAARQKFNEAIVQHLDQSKSGMK